MFEAGGQGLDLFLIQLKIIKAFLFKSYFPNDKSNWCFWYKKNFILNKVILPFRNLLHTFKMVNLILVEQNITEIKTEGIAELKIIFFQI